MCENVGKRFLTAVLIDDIVMTKAKQMYRIIVRLISLQHLTQSLEKASMNCESLRFDLNLGLGWKVS